MIRKIIIDNFQSHKHTEIDFADGVNSIVGATCSGKTAILRSLYWVIENRPSGISTICSNWNKDKKGNPIKEISVTVVLDNGFVKRYRNSESNGYIIHYSDGTEKVLEAIKTDVPEEVRKFLNIGTINVQKQMDNPFLLSDSAPEAARFLNSIVHLDSIDTTLSNAEHDKRNTNSQIKSLENDINENELKLSDYSIVDSANDLVSRIEKFDDKIADIESEMVELNNDIHKFDDIKDYSEELSLIDEIQDLNFIIADSNDEINELENDIVRMNSVVPDMHEEQELVNEIESIEIPDISDFEEQIENYKYHREQIARFEKIDKELQEQLPETCPYCGHKLEECDD